MHTKKVLLIFGGLVLLIVLSTLLGYDEGYRVGRQEGFDAYMDAPQLSRSYEGENCILESKKYIKTFPKRSDGSCWAEDAP